MNQVMDKSSLNEDPDSGVFAIKEENFDDVEDETTNFRKNTKSIIMSQRFTDLDQHHRLSMMDSIVKSYVASGLASSHMQRTSYGEKKQTLSTLKSISQPVKSAQINTPETHNSEADNKEQRITENAEEDDDDDNSDARVVWNAIKDNNFRVLASFNFSLD